MRHTLQTLLMAAAFVFPMAVAAQSTDCDSVGLPYHEGFDSETGTLPDCWTYNSTYVGWNNWPATSGDGELMFKAYSAGQPAVLPYLGMTVGKLGITFKTKCGTDAEGDGILIGVADASGNLIEWIDTIFDANHSRNAWVWHTYLFTRYSGAGERIALGRLWNSTGDHWVAIDDIDVYMLPSCYPPEELTGHNLGDAAATWFSWACYGSSTEWQVYVDTVTTAVDSVDTALYTTVGETGYAVPEGVLRGGGKYAIHVRSVCDNEDRSPWVSVEFGAGTYVMNNSGAMDAITRCGLVVYDNGGPVAGYMDNSNSALVVYPEGVGNELEVYGGVFGFGSSGATLNIYDGVGSAGAPVFTYNTASGRDTMTTTLCTSTQGALTIRFTSSGNMAHTGYELYVRCTGEPTCRRPSHVEAGVVNATTATVRWEGNSPVYKVYHRQTGMGSWSLHTVTADSVVLTGLAMGESYEVYVKGECSPTDTSISSNHVCFTMPDSDVDPECPTPTALELQHAGASTVTVGWSSTGSKWQVECGELRLTTTSNPMTVIGLQPATQYDVRVRTLCGDGGKSEWTQPLRVSTNSVEGIDAAVDEEVVLHPNPASEVVTVSLPEGGGEVAIVDALGRVVSTHTARGATLDIGVADLAPGTYLVRITTADTTLTRRLMVKR